jgi:hypothetical protein
MGQFFPARADRDVFAETVEEELDLAEGEAHLAREADEQDAVEGVAGVAARAAYQDFLGLWKDADPDVPILKEAKAEYVRLQ